MLSNYKFKILKGEYYFLSINKSSFDKLPKSINIFSIIHEKEGVTLIIEKNKFNSIKKYIKNYKIDKDYEILTYDGSTDLAMVGFMAKVSKILAKNNISVNPVAGYYRDYFLIKKNKIKKALQLLKSN